MEADEAKIEMQANEVSNLASLTDLLLRNLNSAAEELEASAGTARRRPILRALVAFSEFVEGLPAGSEYGLSALISELILALYDLDSGRVAAILKPSAKGSTKSTTDQTLRITAAAFSMKLAKDWNLRISDADGRVANALTKGGIRGNRVNGVQNSVVKGRVATWRRHEEQALLKRRAAQLSDWRTLTEAERGIEVWARDFIMRTQNS